MQKNTLDSLLRGPRVLAEDSGGTVYVLDSQLSVPDLETSISVSNLDELAEDSIVDSADFTLLISSEPAGITEVYDVLPSIYNDVPKQIPEKRKGNIMDILNGNKQPKNEEHKNNSSDFEDQLSLVNRTTDITNLEQKMHKPSDKSVNIKDFLLGTKKKTEPILVDLEDSSNITELESRIYLNQKKVSTKDLLRSKTPQKEYKVTLKVDKEALAFYKKYESLLKSRGTKQFVRQKKLFVTLKITGERLLPFQSKVDEHIQQQAKVAQENKAKKNNANSVFSLMMKQSATAAVKLTPLQKLKELEPPVLKHDEFHIFEDSSPYRSRDSGFFDNFKIRKRTEPELMDNYLLDIAAHLSESPWIYTSQTIPTFEYLQTLESKCPKENPIFAHLHDLVESDKSQVWPQLFEPTSADALLLLQQNKSTLQYWISNSFAKLKSQSFKGQRKIKKRRRKEEEMKGFIVNDNFFDDETKEEVFMPLLIIHGDTGVGKSASVYAAMKEINGYVHEINAGQARARKHILGTLKELCTTQLVHKQDEDGASQKGIVLLEDCDILFEQDRTFWVVVQEIIEISRRPIIITCTDISVIPSSLYENALEDGAVLDFNIGRPSDLNIYLNYLWGCCYTQGFDIADLVLQQVFSDIRNDQLCHHFDIRRLLVTFQMLCQSRLKPVLLQSESTIVHITKPNRAPTGDISLSSMAKSLDMLSLTDVIESNVSSQLQHEVIENEFIDIYYIDETNSLTQALMPHERKLVTELNDIASRDCVVAVQPQQKFTRNHYRQIINDYVGSRSKKMPAILQGLQGPRTTRSGMANDVYEFWGPDSVGIPDNSISVYLAPTPFVVDFAPYIRYWCSLQLGLNSYNKEEEIRIKTFLQWREFQNKHGLPLKTAPRINDLI